MKGFITSHGRREGREINNDPQRVATGVLHANDEVHVPRLPLTLECSTDLRLYMCEDTVTNIRYLMKTTLTSKPSRYLWKTEKKKEKRKTM